ncbi:MAG: hypothetical protein ACJ796_09005 [Gemmatimonadaceae bacterium]
MPLVPLYGHERLRERLTEATARGTLPASILLHGPHGVGKQRLALWLGQLVLCSGKPPRPCGKCEQCRFTAELRHPDLHWIFPRPRLKDSDPSLEDVRDDYADAIAERLATGGLYGPASGSDGVFVATVRALVRAASLSPALARRKVFIVGDAERMVPQEGADFAANAFLKLLEEPPADTTLILTSSESGALLPTIRSRVIAIRVAPVTESAMQQFIADPRVQAVLRADKAKADDQQLLTAAAGAPGHLLASSVVRGATLQARRLIEAAASANPAAAYKAAMAQGAAGARGSFTDTLDALEVLLHERVKRAVSSGDETMATGAAKALDVVERTKEQAASNVNPQLLTFALLRDVMPLIK